MRIPFEKMKETVTQGFNGGEGLLIAKIFEDDNNKILQAKLTPGSSVGLHRHVPTSETIFILSGKGKAFCGYGPCGCCCAEDRTGDPASCGQRNASPAGESGTICGSIFTYGRCRHH